MNVEVFIEQKAKQLVFYSNKLIAQTVPFNEIKIFAWDILEEWNKIEADDSQPSEYEQVFWHLLYLLQCWPEEKRSDDRALNTSVTQCCEFLSHKTSVIPKGCIGVRP